MDPKPPPPDPPPAAAPPATAPLAAAPPPTRPPPTEQLAAIGFDQWSSHPVWQRWRLKRLVIFALVVLPLLGVGVLYFSFRIAGLRATIQTSPWFFLIGLAFASFVTGAILSTGMLHRLGAVKAARPPGYSLHHTDSVSGREGWGLLLGIVLAVVGPWWIAQQQSLPFEVRYLSHFLAVCPFIILVLGLWHLEQQGRKIKRKAPLLALALVVGALFLLTLVYDLSQAYHWSGVSAWLRRVIPFYANLELAFIGPIVLGFVVFLLAALWWLWGTVQPAAPEAAEEPAADEKKPEDGAAAAANPPPWVEELIAALPALNCRVNPEQDVELLACLRSSPLIKECPPELRLVFAGDVPTENQFAAFEGFRRNYQAHNEKATKAGANREHSFADLLIEGEPGSGRSTTLAACAIYAAAARGQGVLLVVPDEHRRTCMVQRLQRHLHYARMEAYLGVDVLASEGLAAWLGKEPQAALPMILVVTVPDLEQLVFDQPHLPVERVKRLLLLLEVVGIDDFTEFPEAHRAHLPLILAKHRLLLEAEFGLPQYVVTCPPLHPLAREQFLRGVFGMPVGAADASQVAPLLPRPSQPAWFVRIQTDDLTKATDSLVCWCLQHSVNTLLYRKGIDEGQVETQLRDLHSKIQKQDDTGKLTIIASLDDPLTPEIQPDAIFYQAAVGENICLALQLRGNRQGTVIFAIHPEGETEEHLPAQRMTVVVDRSAFPLVAAHLRSLWRFLPAGSPINVSLWQQLGVDPNQKRKGDPDSVRGRGLFYDFLGKGEDLTAQIWGYLAPLETDETASPVMVEHLWAPGTQLLQLGANEHLLCLALVESSRTPDRETAIAHWVSSTGQELGLVDLSRLAEFRHAAERHAYVMETINPSPRGYQLEVAAFRGNGQDLLWPVLALQWTVLPASHLKRLGGSQDFGVEWYAVAADAPQEIACRMLGHYDSYGRTQPIDDVTFTYPATLAFLVLRPRGGSTQQVAAAVVREWDTGGDAAFLPGLTGALNYALQLLIPGCTYYARCVAFGLSGPGDLPGDAVVWLVEPASTGQTALGVVKQVLKDDGTREKFFTAAQWLLQQLAERPAQREQILRRFGRIAYRNDGADENLNQSRALLTEVLNRLAAARSQATVRLPEAPFNTDDPTSFTLKPTVTLPTPAWDPEAQVTDWAGCLASLWPDAVRLQPDLDAAALRGGKLAWHFLVSVVESTSEQRQALVQQARALGLETASWQETVSLTPPAGATGHQFQMQLLQFLAHLPEAIPPHDQGTVLSLWAIPREQEAADRRPGPDDPLTVTVMGGLRPTGLLLSRRPETTTIAKPRAETPQNWLLPYEARLPVPAIEKAEKVSGKWSPWQMPAPALFDYEAPGAVACRWRHEHKEYACFWGFSLAESRARYVNWLNSQKFRISGGFFSYLFNDPCLDPLTQLADHLAQLYGAQRVGSPDFARYLLSFVQSFPYIKDPEAETDWPRFPSEFLLNHGGDCEDSSLMLSFLLARFGYDFGLLAMPTHMAVGIAGPFSGTNYFFNGTKYYYAETATNASYHPLGLETSMVTTAKVLPYPASQLPGQAPVLVINAKPEYQPRIRVWLQLLCLQPCPDDLIIGCFARPGFDESPGEDEQYVACGVVRLPAKGKGGIVEAEFSPVNGQLNGREYTYDLIVCQPDRTIVGRWFGIARFTRKSSP